jgi:very-short-patch-repair endonuclease
MTSWRSATSPGQSRGTDSDILPHVLTVGPEPGLPVHAVTGFVLGAPAGSVLALAGIGSESLRALLDRAEAVPGDRCVLFAKIEAAPTSETIVDQTIDVLADTARRLWPIWYSDKNFADCGSDTLGRTAAGVRARETAAKIAGALPSWSEAAARLACEGRRPRLDATPATELAQLALAISRFGLTLIADVSSAVRRPEPLVRALEWIAQNSPSAVIALFSDLPDHVPPFDRILYGARQVVTGTASPAPVSQPTRPDAQTVWLSPWRGSPHPWSETEQRLARRLAADDELAPLFRFNATVETVRGSRPKVDLVWEVGKLAVELDAYATHGGRLAFLYDRNRDYELALSGYTVLRLANDEIEQDIEKAVEKVRDLVRLCRRRAAEG